MRGNHLEQEIIGIFNRDISAHISINQIAKLLGKTYPYIYSKVTELLDEEILTKVEVGRSYLCSINLENDKARALLMLNEAYNKDIFVKKKKYQQAVSEIYKIKKIFKMYTIFFSNSTFYFVLDHIHDKEAIKNSSSFFQKQDLCFLTPLTFLDLIKDQPSLLHQKIILYGPENYFELLSECSKQLVYERLIS